MSTTASIVMQAIAITAIVISDSSSFSSEGAWELPSVGSVGSSLGFVLSFGAVSCVSVGSVGVSTGSVGTVLFKPVAGFMTFPHFVHSCAVVSVASGPGIWLTMRLYPQRPQSSSQAVSNICCAIAFFSSQPAHEYQCPVSSNVYVLFQIWYVQEQVSSHSCILCKSDQLFL